jgi:hypothetical protein
MYTKSTSRCSNIYLHISVDKRGVIEENVSDAICNSAEGVNIPVTAVQESHVFRIHHHTKMVITTSISEEHVSL